MVFSVDPSTSASGMSGAVDVDAERDHAQVVGEVDAVDHQRDQVQLREVGGEQVTASSRSTSKSAVSRKFVAMTETALTDLLGKASPGWIWWR